MWEGTKVFLAKPDHPRLHCRDVAVALKWNAIRTKNRHGDCSKKGIETNMRLNPLTMDISCANPIRPDIPNLHKPTTLVVHPKQKCKNKQGN